jgi:glycogen debranching enzyme
VSQWWSPPSGQPGGPGAALDPLAVTLVEGPAFCISRRSGDVVPGGADGVWLRDTRYLSRLEVRLNGEVPEPLAAVGGEPFTAMFVARSPAPVGTDSTLLLRRNRYLGLGLREDLEVRNFAEEPAYCEVEVLLAADFATVAELRAGRPPRSEPWAEVVEGRIEVHYRRGDNRRVVRLTLAGEGAARVAPGSVTYEVIIPPKGAWRACLEVAFVLEGEEIEPRWRCGSPIERSEAVERLESWRRDVPTVVSDHPALDVIVTRSTEDLAALRVFDPEYPERAVVAAGAPWAMSLFGRDSLLTAYLALLADPGLALGVVETLARFQGEDVDPRSEEEPGRILYELRFDASASLSFGGFVSYACVDATPLFVILLGELRRWGLAPEVVDRLLPHADRALAWIEEFGDRDGDGYVEYQRASDRSPHNLCWKETEGAIRFADGRPGVAPLAVAEVQAYVYAAYVARAHFARESGDAEGYERWAAKAGKLRAAFNRDFWMDDRGWLAMALDRDKVPVDALASNVGHCLWTGILDEDRASMVAKQLTSPELFNGWGVRTLGRSMAGWNPLSHHLGSVWPHDTALAAAGLMRYGFVDEAHRLIGGMLDAAAACGGRLPELVSGIDRDELPVPVAFPGTSAPKALSAAAPLMFLRTLLRIDPWIPAGKLWLAPALPPDIRRLRIERIPILGGRITVEVDGDDVSVEGLPPEVTLIKSPRRPMTATSS